MSVKIMGLVWDCALPRDEKYVLLAYADHADHDGRGIYPSYGRIAWKTGYSRRQVIRITDSLTSKGILIPDGASINNIHRWRIDLSKLPAREDYAAFTDSDAPSGSDAMSLLDDESSDILSPPEGQSSDIMSPHDDSGSDILSPPENQGVTPCHPLGDKISQGVTFATSRGDTMSPKPSLTVIKEPSLKQNDGIDRIISGSKVTPRRAWQIVLDRLEREMPKSAYSQWVRDATVAAYDAEQAVLIVRAPGEYARDWLNSRVVSTVNRYLAGICNQSVEVRFVSE